MFLNAHPIKIRKFVLKDFDMHIDYWMIVDEGTHNECAQEFSVKYNRLVHDISEDTFVALINSLFSLVPHAMYFMGMVRMGALSNYYKDDPAYNDELAHARVEQEGFGKSSSFAMYQDFYENTGIESIEFSDIQDKVKIKAFRKLGPLSYQVTLPPVNLLSENPTEKAIGYPLYAIMRSELRVLEQQLVRLLSQGIKKTSKQLSLFAETDGLVMI